MTRSEAFASWSRPDDGRLIVSNVVESKVVWGGPVSARLANGRQITVWENRLVIGIGDLLNPDLNNDPQESNGTSLLSIPTGRPIKNLCSSPGERTNPSPSRQRRRFNLDPRQRTRRKSGANRERRHRPLSPSGKARLVCAGRAQPRILGLCWL